ncbi:cadmium-translocating P-type ATPase [Tissierella creatinini]|nr:cadmium-translocating P-type ATPase [Tissierella creatinini]TJX63057.1 cadmium-translocating P-type ATPase [Soehngenia saccharolytica]
MTTAVKSELELDGLVEKSFMLEGLGCANCAAKMEAGIKRLDGVINANVNFMNKKLNIEMDSNSDIKGIINKAEKIIKSIEAHVDIMPIGENSSGHSNGHDHSSHNHGHSHGHNHGDDSIKSEFKKELFKILIAGAIMVLGFVLDLSPMLELMIFLAAFVIVGSEVLLRAVNNIRRGQVFDENFLMGIATIGAFIIGEYAEGVGVMLFYQVGELFQDVAVHRSRKSISDLMDIRPDYANLKYGDRIKVVSPEEVKIGDIIVVKPGEKIPLDGKVIEGNSSVDTSHLTGESMPRDLEIGDEALSGFININGILSIQVSKAFGESTVSKILDLVQNASSKKAPTENFITKFARYYTPAVVFGALAIAVIPPLIMGQAFSEWLYRALIFLVISCPCALVISIPLGFFGGIGGASNKGILIKGSNYLEALNHVEAVVFDKTGTLTKGVFQVTEINPSVGFESDELLEMAAYAESYSNHPIAVSILKAYNKAVDKSLVDKYEEIAGNGIKAVINGSEILAGNPKLMDGEKIEYKGVESIGTIIHLALDKEYAGYLVISDEIKRDSKDAVKELKALGIKKTIMLTGDTKLAGEKIAYELGLDEVYSELLPHEKVEKLEMIEARKSPKGKIIYVGDGINDAPVLARADIGVAMGGLGSDAAIEAADVVIMMDEPSKIATAIKIAKKTKTIVWQNIFFALGVKGIFLIMGAFGIVTMWEAVFADVGVAVIAILNATRAMK